MEEQWSLKKFQYKMFLSHEKFCDFDQFYSLYKKHLQNLVDCSDFVLREFEAINKIPIDEDFLRLYENEHYIFSISKKIHSAINDYFRVNIDIPVFFVESFPGNFTLDSWKAISVDASQAEYYAIDEGIYFKNEFLVPYLFEILLCHEIIHQVLPLLSSRFNKIKSDLDEEGLCDFFSYFVLLEYSIIEKPYFIEKFLTFNRGLSGYVNYIRYSYWNASYKASLLYYFCGKELFFKRYIYGSEPLEVDETLEMPKPYSSNVVQCIYKIFLKIASILILPENEYVILKTITEDITVDTVSKIADTIGYLEKNVFSACESLQNKWLLYIQEGLIHPTVSKDWSIYYYIV